MTDGQVYHQRLNSYHKIDVYYNSIFLLALPGEPNRVYFNLNYHSGEVLTSVLRFAPPTQKITPSHGSCVRSDVLPGPRHANVNYAGYAQHQYERRHQDQSVREYGPLDGDASGLCPGDHVHLLLQGHVDVGHDDR